MKKTYLVIAVFYFFLFTGILTAQPSNKKENKESIEKVIKQKLMEQVGLDEPTADKYLGLSKSNRKEIKTYIKEKKQIMESIELNPAASDIGSKLDDLYSIDGKISGQRLKFYEELKTFLTSEQIAKTVILRKKMFKEVRDKRRQMKSIDKPEGSKDSD